MEVLRRLTASLEGLIQTGSMEPVNITLQDSEEGEIKPVSTALKTRLTGLRCPKCGRYLVETITLRGPLIKKAVGLNMFVEASKGYECPNCGYRRAGEKKMLIPLAALEFLAGAFKDDFEDFIEEAGKIAERIERTLSKVSV